MNHPKPSPAETALREKLNEENKIVHRDFQNGDISASEMKDRSFAAIRKYNAAVALVMRAK